MAGLIVLGGVLEGLGGQQAAAFAKGAEQDAVQQLLRAAQDFGLGDGGVLAAEAGEGALADVRVEGVELVGERASDGFRRAEQFVQVAITVRGSTLRSPATEDGHDAFGAQQEDEAFEQGLIGSQPDGLEAFVGLLVRAFLIQPRLAHRGDDDPVAREVDGLAMRRTTAPAGAGPPGGIAVWIRQPFAGKGYPLGYYTTNPGGVMLAELWRRR